MPKDDGNSYNAPPTDPVANSISQFSAPKSNVNSADGFSNTSVPPSNISLTSGGATDPAAPSNDAVAAGGGDFGDGSVAHTAPNMTGFGNLPKQLAEHGINPDGTKMTGEAYVNAVATHPDNFSQAEKDQMKAFFKGVSSVGGSTSHSSAPLRNAIAASGVSGGSGGGSGGGSVAHVAPATIPKHQYALIRGDGPNTGDAVNLAGNGAAVYAVNERGERFHITENLATQMQTNGTWYEPEVKPQAQVDGMAMRFTVDSPTDLRSINNATVGDNLMLIKGSAPGNPDSNVLAGNGNAVYAIDTNGNKFHVTEAAYSQITTQGGGATPPLAIVTQPAADVGPISGTLNANAGGKVEADTDPALMDSAVLAAKHIVGGSATSSTEPAANPIPVAPVAPADEALGVGNSTQGTGDFKLVIGSIDGSQTLPDTTLVGNGKAVYAVNAAGQKFHVTAALHDQMVADGTWQSHPLQAMHQGDIDAMKNGSNVSLTNIDQLRSINIGAGQEFRLVRGGLNGTGTFDGSGNGPLDGNSAAVYAVTSTGDRYHVTPELAAKLDNAGAYGNVEQLDQHEIDSLGTMRGEVKTVADLNKAVKDQSGAVGGFDGDTSGLPGGIPPIQGYSDPH